MRWLGQCGTGATHQRVNVAALGYAFFEALDGVAVGFVGEVLVGMGSHQKRNDFRDRRAVAVEYFASPHLAVVERIPNGQLGFEQPLVGLKVGNVELAGLDGLVTVNEHAVLGQKVHVAASAGEQNGVELVPAEEHCTFAEHVAQPEDPVRIGSVDPMGKVVTLNLDQNCFGVSQSVYTSFLMF